MKFKKGDIIVHKLGKVCVVIDAYETSDGARYDVRDYSLSIYTSLEESEFKKSLGKQTNHSTNTKPKKNKLKD